MAKHKHYELMKKWIEDTDIAIQYQLHNGEWLNSSSPTFDPETEYRIKPDPRAARDMAIAKAVKSAINNCYMRCESDDDLAAIIATVKEAP